MLRIQISVEDVSTGAVYPNIREPDSELADLEQWGRDRLGHLAADHAAKQTTPVTVTHRVRIKARGFFFIVL